MDHLQVLTKNGYTPDNIGRIKAAKLFKCHPSKAGRILNKLRNKQSVSNAPVGRPDETQEFKGQEWNITLNRSRIHTLEQLLDHFQVDRSKWEVLSWVANKWEVGSSNEDGKFTVEPLYQVKATFRKASAPNLEFAKKEVEELKLEAKKSIRIPVFSIGNTVKSGNSLEISVFDAHFGKMSWEQETGWENYDTNIALRDYNKAVDTILSRNSIKLDEICYVVGQDLLNYDTRSGTTTSGTAIDTDSRYHKVFRVVRKCIQEQIDKMRSVVPKVNVIISPGNHDNLSCWHLGDSLECLYSNSKDVKVMNDPAPRKYYQFGTNLVMFCHGDKGKKEDYPLIMATEQPNLWSQSRIREVHTGHLHHESVKEFKGTKVRIIPALTATDYYHSENGWVGCIRGAQAFQWNREDGLIGTIEYSIKEGREETLRK